jgi:putative ABC transport system ATP-binding protein
MIRIENLHKSYKSGKKNVEVLHGIDLTIHKNELLVLKGVSGSGKSTLLSLIAGFEKPSSGAVFIENEPISKLPDLHQSRLRNRKIGFVFQSFNLFEDMSCYDNVLIPTIVHPKKQDIAAAMQSANIWHKKDELAKNLSGGEKQRCSIARALVNNPDILICDEPTANLDKQNAQNFLHIIKALHQQGKTIIVATHDPLFEQEGFADRIVLMESGKIV